MAIDKRVLLAGLQQLNRKYVGKNVDRVTLQMVNGKPAYIMQGRTQDPPPGLPGTFQLGPSLILPIIWAYRAQPLNGTPLAPPVERDLDREMWAGVPPAIKRRDTVTVFTPGSAPIIPTAVAIPEASVTPLRLVVDATGPLGWWDLPLDIEGCLCCSYYQRPVTVLTYKVPEDRVLYIDGWAFFSYVNVPTGWAFNVRFMRDGDTLLSYDEIVVDPANPDPARRCLFSGSIEQVMQSYLRIDRNQTFSVVLTPKGLFPFVNNPLQALCGNICCLIHSHATALLDNRDGGSRPKDVGAMRDDLSGTGMLAAVTAEDVAQLQAWLDGASANAASPSVDGGSSTSASNDVVGASFSKAADEAAMRALQAQADAKLADASTASNSKLLTTIVAAGAVAVALGDTDDIVGSEQDEVYGSSLAPNPFPDQ